MSYPPPGGQPPMDPYGGAPQQDPYGQPPQPDPYGQPPQPDPYAQPPQHDPYGGAPQQDPYGQPPQPDPYNAPASGVPGQQPGYGPPVSAMPMGVPPQQQGGGGSNVGWIVGGVAGLVIIAMAVVGVLFATGAFSGDDDERSGGGGSDESDQDEPTDEGSDDGGGGEEDDQPQGGSGTYAYPGDDVCSTVDVDAWSSTGMDMPSEGVTSIGGDYSTSSSMYCNFWAEDPADTLRYVSVTWEFTISDDPAEIDSAYQEYMASGAEPYSGVGDEGVIAPPSDDLYYPDLDIAVKHGNAAFHVRIAGGSEHGFDDPQAMAEDLLSQFMQACST